MPLCRAPAIVAIVLSLLLSPAAWAKVQGSASVQLAPGIDTNPRRTVGDDSPTDGFLGLSAGAKGRLPWGETRLLSGQYDLGLRKFLEETGEDLVVQQGELEYSRRLDRFLVGAAGSGKLRLSRAGTRDYLDGSGEAFVDWAVVRRFSLRLSGGVRAFRYPADSAHSFFGPQGRLVGRWSPNRRHTLALGLVGALPDYTGKARLDDGSASDEGRRDNHLGAQLAYGYRGPVALQFAYAGSRVRSNSFGESTTRHRFSGVVSTKLPLGFFGIANAAWQFIRYADGILLSEDLLLLEDEAQSSVGLKLARPLKDWLDVEARWALYWITLPPRAGADPGESARYVRQTMGLGLAARW